MPALAAHPEWRELAAVRAGRVYVADGNLYFNRSGPLLFDTPEILAEILHPASFPPAHEGAVWRRYGAGRRACADRGAVEREVEGPARVRGLEVGLVGRVGGTVADQIHFAALVPNTAPHGPSPLLAISVAADHSLSSKSRAVQLLPPASTSGTVFAVRQEALVTTSGATPPSASTVSSPMMPRSLPPWLDVFVCRAPAMTFLAAGMHVQRHVDGHGGTPQLLVEPTIVPLTYTSHSLSAVIRRCDVNVAVVGIVAAGGGTSATTRVHRDRNVLRRVDARGPS
jgi:hypothetical protein